MLLILNIFAQDFVSMGKSPKLVELYSSEGCSSCPPAEAWMAELSGNPRLFSDFVPVNFHVDYWNKLGWVDVYSQKMFTMRQSAYADLFRSTKVYTPQFIVQGYDSGTSGSDQFLKRGTEEAGKAFRVSVNSKGAARIETSPDFSGDAYIALLGNGFVTEVKAGENSGSTLKHNFVVLELKKIPLVNGKGRLELNRNPKKVPKSFSVAAWLTPKDSLRPVRVLGGHLDWK